MTYKASIDPVAWTWQQREGKRERERAMTRTRSTPRRQHKEMQSNQGREGVARCVSMCVCVRLWMMSRTRHGAKKWERNATREGANRWIGWTWPNQATIVCGGKQVVSIWKGIGRFVRLCLDLITVQQLNRPIAWRKPCQANTAQTGSQTYITQIYNAPIDCPVKTFNS